MLTVESSWQSKRNTLISHGVIDRNQLASCATQAIAQLYELHPSSLFSSYQFISLFEIYLLFSHRNSETSYPFGPSFS